MDEDLRRFSISRLNVAGKKVFGEGTEVEIKPNTYPLPLSVAINLAMSEVSKGRYGRDIALHNAFILAGAHLLQMEGTTVSELYKKYITSKSIALDKKYQELVRYTRAPEPDTTESTSKQTLVSLLKLGDFTLSNVGYILGTKLMTRKMDLQYAKNIDAGLLMGEQGIHIAGIAHNALRYLPSDIKIQFIDNELAHLWKLGQRGRDIYSEVERFASFRRMAEGKIG